MLRPDLAIYQLRSIESTPLLPFGCLPILVSTMESWRSIGYIASTRLRQADILHRQATTPTRPHLTAPNRLLRPPTSAHGFRGTRQASINRSDAVMEGLIPRACYSYVYAAHMRRISFFEQATNVFVQETHNFQSNSTSSPRPSFRLVDDHVSFRGKQKELEKFQSIK